MAYSTKRPLAGGDDATAGALVPAKRSRHELVPVASSSDQQKRGALIPAVSVTRHNHHIPVVGTVALHVVTHQSSVLVAGVSIGMILDIITDL